MTTVVVALGSEGFDIIATPMKPRSGPMHFIITDVGFGHELLVIKTATTASAIIASAIMGGQFDESPYDIRVDTGTVAHGDTVEHDATLEPGHYVLVCNEPGHAHLGMAIDWSVATNHEAHVKHLNHLHHSRYIRRSSFS